MILKNALIYTPENTFKKGDLAVNGNVISEPAAGDSKIFDASGLYAIPGLTDIHLHGCMGHDFCDATEDTLEAIAAYQARSGVTVSYTHLDVYKRQPDALPRLFPPGHLSHIQQYSQKYFHR